MARVVVSSDVLLEKILEGVKRLDVDGGHTAQQNPQPYERQEQPEVVHVKIGRFQGRNHERRVRPEEQTAHIGRRGRGDGQGIMVRALTSCSMISIAKSTPPMGVLKVAAIPAPAPAAINVMRCQGGMRMSLSQR